MSGSGAGGRGTTRRDRIAPAWAWVAAAAAAPSASAARSTRLVVSAIPARSPSRLLALANGAAAPARSTIVASPGDSDEPATPSSSSLGTTPRLLPLRRLRARRGAQGPVSYTHLTLPT